MSRGVCLTKQNFLQKTVDVLNPVSYQKHCRCIAMLSVILCFQMQNFKIKKKILSLWNSGCMASLQQYPASLRNPVLSSCLRWLFTESVTRTRDGMPGPQDRAGAPGKSWRVWTHSLIQPAVLAQGHYCGTLLYTVPLVEVKVHGFRVLGNSRPARKGYHLKQRAVLLPSGLVV